MFGLLYRSFMSRMMGLSFRQGSGSDRPYSVLQICHRCFGLKTWRIFSCFEEAKVQLAFVRDKLRFSKIGFKIDLEFKVPGLFIIIRRDEQYFGVLWSEVCWCRSPGKVHLSLEKMNIDIVVRRHRFYCWWNNAWVDHRNQIVCLSAVAHRHVKMIISCIITETHVFFEITVKDTGTTDEQKR